jgi:hypothetical protein
MIALSLYHIVLDRPSQSNRIYNSSHLFGIFRIALNKLLNQQTVTDADPKSMYQTMEHIDHYPISINIKIPNHCSCSTSI